MGREGMRFPIREMTTTKTITVPYGVPLCSLLAMDVVTHTNDAFAIELPLRQIFETPCLEEFALAVAAMRATGTGRVAAPEAGTARIARRPRHDEALLARIETMTDDEVDELFAELAGERDADHDG